MLKSIISTATFKQSSVTFIGTILNGLLGALFYIVVARVLGPVEFGLLTISIVTLTLLSDIADIGTNTGLIRFVSHNLVHDRDKALKFLKLSLEIKLIAWVISFLVIFLLAPFLAVGVFHKSELIIPFKLVAFGIGGALLFTFVTAALQAYQKYFTWSVINIITNFLRLILILILGYYLTLDVKSIVFVYILLPFFGFFITLFILPTRKILQSKDEFSISKELFKYNIPVAVFTIISAFSARLDIYLSAALLSSKEVGLYGAASQLVTVMPQLVSALGLVTSPKFSSFTNNQQMMTYFKKFQLLVSGICLLGILSIPIIVFLIPKIYGLQYQDAVLPFVFLFLAQLIFLFSIPVHHSVIFYFGRPDIFIWVAIGHLILVSILGYFMISNFGVVGASLTVLTGITFNFLYPLIWLLIKLKK